MFLTARGLRENIIAGINSGADDYMVKPFYAEELKARVKSGVRMVTLQRQLLERNMMLEEFVYTVTHDLRTPLIAMEMTTKQASEGIYGELPNSYRKILDTTRPLLKISRHGRQFTQCCSLWKWQSSYNKQRQNFPGKALPWVHDWAKSNLCAQRTTSQSR